MLWPVIASLNVITMSRASDYTTGVVRRRKWHRIDLPLKTIIRCSGEPASQVGYMSTAGNDFIVKYYWSSTGACLNLDADERVFFWIAISRLVIPSYRSWVVYRDLESWRMDVEFCFESSWMNVDIIIVVIITLMKRQGRQLQRRWRQWGWWRWRRKVGLRRWWWQWLLTSDSFTI